MLLCLLVVAAHRVRPEQVDLRGCLFMVLFFCYPTMNSVSLAAWICVDLTGDKRRMLLVEDDRVECEDTQHDIYQALTVVVVAGVGVFIPLAFTYVLWRQSKENVKKRHAFRMKELAEELQVPLKDVKIIRDRTWVYRPKQRLMKKKPKRRHKVSTLGTYKCR